MDVTFLTNKDKEDIQNKMVKRVNGEEQQGGNVDIHADSNPDRHAEYFTITDDGIISLKPEYRGAVPGDDNNRKDFTYAISDNGYGVDGSKNAELPKYLVIPEVVDTTAVVSLAPGMFMLNHVAETIVLPDTVTAIPDRFCDKAVKVRNLYNTENIETIGQAAFQACAIEKAKFPKLTSLAKSAFVGAGFLEYADIGNVAEIPNLAFNSCYNLSRIKGGSNVTTIGNFALSQTYRLNSVEFLPKLTKIGWSAFLRCRLIYDWSSLVGQCSFATYKDFPYATALQLNPNDIWSGCTVTATENPLPTLLSQLDSRWCDREIGTSGIKYSSGCILFSVMHAYCALKGKTFRDIEEFERVIDPEILNSFKGISADIVPMCKALGLNVVHYGEYTQERLQEVFDAIAAGSYVLLPMTPTSDAVGHCALAYGVKENKEFLIADSAFTPGEYIGGTDQGIKYSMVYQNMTKPASDVFIVSLP